MGLEYLGPIQFRVEGRFLSRQYEDDLNQLPLAGYGVLDLQVRKPLAEQLELFVSVENLFDREYAVGRLPIQRLGNPPADPRGSSVAAGILGKFQVPSPYFVGRRYR